VPQPAANVFLIDGEDDYAISGFIDSLEARLGSPDIASLNTTRLDGRSMNMDELKRACFAMPFLAEKRLVIVSQPLARLSDAALRDKFKTFLLSVPETSLLALVHPANLTDERDRKKNKIHWLESWVLKTGGKVAFKHFDLPRGTAMVDWIQVRAKSAGGQFTPAAAARLVGLVGDLPRRADQEIQKLLEYVNYARPVEADDVEHLTPNTAPVADFALVNALRSQNARQAQAVLHKMLEDEEPLRIFHNIVNQFRQLIQVRELMDQRASQEEVARLLGIHPYVAGLALEHARHFTMPVLESIYQRLHDLDYAIKTGEIDCELALDLLVVELTTKTPLPA
jgi:DNA polymerase-3 subunit delta